MTTANAFVGRAPGRMDVMGGIADYSGSLVLQMAIRQNTTVSLSLRNDGVCSLVSRANDGHELRTELLLGELKKGDTVDYAFARSYLRSRPDMLWAGYIVGCGLVLQQEFGINFTGGDFEIYSEVPLGKGVSSSASLEVATMKAFEKAFNIAFKGTELPVLAQKVENLVVGAPCGLMDQLASHFGKVGKLLPIVCQPDTLLPKIDIPDDLKFVGIDSGVRHSVGGASYGDVRCAAFMGYTIIASHLGVSPQQIQQACASGQRSQLPYKGYLCNIPAKEFKQKFIPLLPDTMTGEEFIKNYGGTIDPVTSVAKDGTYKILNCTAHPVYENERVTEFMKILQTRQEQTLSYQRLGELMYASNESYNRCGLGSDRTEEIVSRAKLFSNAGVLGAKITGGGSGGTVCLLVKGEEGFETAQSIHQYFCNKYRHALVFFC